MTSYPLAEVDQRTRECGPQWRAAFDACVVDREANGKWVRVDRKRPEWQEVVRLGAAKPATNDTKGVVARLASGVKGVAKALAGVDRAAAEVVTARIAICETCPECTKFLGRPLQCKLCGCAVRLKVTINGEKCPAGKW